MTKLLSRAETEVARLIVEGKSLREIAKLRRGSRKTAAALMCRARAKAGVKNNVQFALSAMGRALTPQTTTTTP